MNTEIKNILKKSLQCHQTSRGAYQALKLVGASPHLPGLESCIQDMEDVIKQIKLFLEKN